MILYKLIFFRLPYPEIDPTDVDGIEREVLRYGGFKATVDTIDSCRRRGLPRGTLMLLEGLLRVDPMQRPTSERVLAALKEETVNISTFTSPLSEADKRIVARTSTSYTPSEKRRSQGPEYYSKTRILDISLWRAY